MSRSYQKGRRTEYEAKTDLESTGWRVHRVAGSKSEVDLIAFKGDEVLVVQVKRNKPLTASVREALRALPWGEHIAVEYWNRTDGSIGFEKTRIR